MGEKLKAEYHMDNHPLAWGPEGDSLVSVLQCKFETINKNKCESRASFEHSALLASLFNFR